MVLKNNYYTFLQRIIQDNPDYDTDYDTDYDNHITEQKYFFYEDDEILITDISKNVQIEDVRYSSSKFYKYIIGSMIAITCISVSVSYFISKKRNKKIN